MELTQIKGLGMKTCEKLDKLGIKDIKSLLTFYPFRYNIIKRSNLKEVKNNEQITIDGIIESIPSIFYFKGKKDKMNFKLNTGFKTFNIVIFNRGFLKNKLTIGTEITVVGKIDKIKSIIVVSDLYFGKIDKERIEPVYHTTFGLSNKQIRKYINSTVNLGYEIDDYIPTFISQKYHLLNKSEAIRHLHNPVDEIKLKQSIKRTKYEELFVYMLKMNYLKQSKKIDHGLKRDISYDRVEQFIDDLPFELTRDQIKSVEEIYKDLTEDMRMNRLLQGDVGSGKTIVAFITMYINYLGGYQSALMAPTEILAQQHYQNSKELFKKYNIDIALLTGKTKTKEKKEIYEKLKNGTIDFIIGTHALFTDDVIYKNLGLVITDEQHRFGVNQRSNLKNKGTTPDILYMSATPIPRTYALTLYGDMDVSNIKTLPSGKKQIITTLKTEKEIKDVLTSMYNELKQRHQIYVVAPLIEESDKIDLKNVYDLEEKFNKAFGKICNIDILHGKMKPSEKEEVMQKFKENKINILISTTVIEVGVDVKNATMMVIFDAERFGLSALHQLRGRVGRNNLQSYCILISNYEKERLNVLTKTNDGFKVSEEDFLLRGSGDIFGLRQSGDMIFKMADLKQDFNILLKAKEDSEYLLKNLTKIDPKEQQKYLNLITKATNLD
jgi:ATP-dependent DNA helicase RecG